MNVKDTVEKFDYFLEKKSLHFEAVIIGGAALSILDIISRETKDIDLIDPKIPDEIKEASILFALENPALHLDPYEWVNNGPIALIQELPVNWKKNIVLAFKGKSLTLYTLGRTDLLRSKLFAFADRDIDYNDCIALKPTLVELNECYSWVLDRDTSELWPKRVDEIFHVLKKDLKLE